MGRNLGSLRSNLMGVGVDEGDGGLWAKSYDTFPCRSNQIRDGFYVHV